MLCKNYNGWTEGVKTVSMNNLLESHRHSNDIMTETDVWLWSHDDWGARPGQARAGVKSCKNSLDWGSCDELWSGDNWRGECDMISDDQQKHFSTSFYCQQPVKTFIMMIIMEQCRPSTSLLSTILLLLSCKCSLLSSNTVWVWHKKAASGGHRQVEREWPEWKICPTSYDKKWRVEKRRESCCCFQEMYFVRWSLLDP